MKNKKERRWHYYLIAFLIFILFMIFIDFNFNGMIAEFFVKTILEDTEQVDTYMGEMVRGNFRWDRLKDFIIVIALSIFLIILLIINLSLKLGRKREREDLSYKIEDRIIRLSRDEEVETDNSLINIDGQIVKILNERDNMKRQKDIEISKKNDLVTYLAHDLKTPLTSIIGYLNILDEGLVPEEVQKDYIEKILEKSYHLENLTDQFFDITRFNLQQIPMNKIAIDGYFFLTQIRDEFKPILQDKELNIELDVDEDFNIYADGQLLARVIDNLLKNAVNYSHRNTSINIEGYNNDDMSIIKIENLGDIVSNEELDLIFEKFYRKDTARSQSAGSGLGLAIARQIIERHDGELKADSINGRTSFTIIIPKENNI